MATILVVEDSAEAMRPLTRLLKQEGYDVLTARDAYSAAAAVRNDHPDLMLLDVGIPPMDGLTMLMLLRDEHQIGDTPVILVTGACDKETATRAAGLGVKAYMVKSQFTPDQLLSEIRRYLRPPASAAKPG